MRMTWAIRCAAPVACALWLGGCGNAQDPGANLRRAQDNRAGSQQVALSGCVQAAPGTNQYVLQNVRLAPVSTQPSDAMTAPAVGITEGAWVKLRTDDRDDQLRGHIGKMVSITGTVSDSGQNTIGTSGASHGPDDPGPRTDQSRAAAPEHHSEKVANATTAEITVHRVTALDRECQTIGKIGEGKE